MSLQRGGLVVGVPRRPQAEDAPDRVDQTRAVQSVRGRTTPQVFEAEEHRPQPEPVLRSRRVLDRPQYVVRQPAGPVIRSGDPRVPVRVLDRRQHGPERQLGQRGTARLGGQRCRRYGDRDRSRGAARQLTQVARRDPARVAQLVLGGRLPRRDDLGPAVPFGADQHGLGEQQLGQGPAVQAEAGLGVHGLGPGGHVGPGGGCRSVDVTRRIRRSPHGTDRDFGGD